MTMHILLVISSLGAGGAERVLTELASEWQSRGRRVTLVTIDSEHSDFYLIHPGVKRIALGLKQDSNSLLAAIGNNVRRLLTLRQAIKQAKPDVIVSFVDITNILTIIASAGLRIPVVVSERTDPRQHRIGRFWNRLRRMVYPRTHVVVVQTRDVYQWMQKEIPAARFEVIPNPVRAASGSPKDGYTLPQGKTVVAVGRLAKAKGFDLLINAFAKCAHSFPEWNLVIFGEGPERNTLESLVRKQELTGRVILPGLIREPMAVLPAADLFVLSSRYEGFPNVLLEAMLCGLAVIAADCPSGPREIIDQDQNGVLVSPDDVDALANAMKCLMADISARRALGEHARLVNERFSMESVMNIWESLLNRTMKNNETVRM